MERPTATPPSSEPLVPWTSDRPTPGSHSLVTPRKLPSTAIIYDAGRVEVANEGFGGPGHKFLCRSKVTVVIPDLALTKRPIDTHLGRPKDDHVPKSSSFEFSR